MAADCVIASPSAAVLVGLAVPSRPLLLTVGLGGVAVVVAE